MIEMVRQGRCSGTAGTAHSGEPAWNNEGGGVGIKVAD